MRSALFVRMNEKYVRVPVQDILYLIAAGSYLKLVTAAGQYTLSQNLRQFMKRNEVPLLLRVHRSYLINVDHVQAFDHTHVYIGNDAIPIGASYRTEFLKAVRCV